MAIQLKAPSVALSGHFEAAVTQINHSVPTSQAAAERRHGFWVKNIGLLIPHDMRSEVSQGLSVRRLPNTPPWLCGMANLRGNMTPVFDIGLFLGFHSDKLTARSQLFVQIDGEWVGMYSDALPVRVILNTANRLDALPPIPDQLQSFISFAYQQEHIWLDWDGAGFLSWLAEQR